MSARALIEVPTWVVSSDAARESTCVVAEECPVALSYNGMTQAVMMATPADLRDFAFGFSMSEQIARPDEITHLEVIEHDTGFECRMWLRPEAEARLAQRRRHMLGPIGCGLCGIDSLTEALRPLPSLPVDAHVLCPRQITAALQTLSHRQALHDATRAVHAAGFLGLDGSVVVREDVGRHNALDKLLGARRGQSTGAVLLTSRVSLDMVQKTVVAGIPILIAVSAPTGHALRAAQEAGLTVVARAGDDGFQIFTHPQRINLQEVPDVA